MTETGNVQESPPTLIVIRVRNPGKKYTLGESQEKYLAVRDAIVKSVKAPFRRFHRAPTTENFVGFLSCCPINPHNSASFASPLLHSQRQSPALH